MTRTVKHSIHFLHFYLGYKVMSKKKLRYACLINYRPKTQNQMLIHLTEKACCICCLNMSDEIRKNAQYSSPISSRAFLPSKLVVGRFRVQFPVTFIDLIVLNFPWLSPKFAYTGSLIKTAKEGPSPSDLNPTCGHLALTLTTNQPIFN